MNFTEVVRKRLFELKMYKKTLSKLTGISYSHLNDLMSNKKRWNEETMNKVCKVLSLQIKFEPKASWITKAILNFVK